VKKKKSNNKDKLRVKGRSRSKEGRKCRLMRLPPKKMKKQIWTSKVASSKPCATMNYLRKLSCISLTSTPSAINYFLPV